jgi:uncharacterized protein
MAAKAEPVPTPDTQHYWDAARRGELALQRCVSCDQAFFYPRSHCPACLGADVEWTVASGRGTLHTYVIAQHAAPGFEAPYAIAIVALEEGPRMMANIIGVPQTPEHLVLDMPLVVDFVEQGAVTLPQFRPAEARS